MNPLLSLKGLPAFSKIQPKDMLEAVQTKIQQNREEINQLLQNQNYTWDDFIYPLELMDEQLDRVCSPMHHINAVVNSDEVREVYNESLKILSEYHTEVGQNTQLNDAFQFIEDSEEYSVLNTEQKQIIENTLLSFKLSGVSLPKEKKEQFGEIKKRLSVLASKFNENVMDATLAWTKHITNVEELAGIPENSLAMLEQFAKTKELEGYLITLDAPSYLAVMKYAEHQELRKEVYHAYATRASDQGEDTAKLDNSPLIIEILDLRQKLAGLLDYQNYAEVSLASKMASSSEQVMGFLTDLVQKSKSMGEKELQELTDFVKETYQVDELEAWDLNYYSEKLRVHLYSISEDELRAYFPEEKVLSGMFEIVNRLYGVSFNERTVDTWHQDVRFFDIFNQENEYLGSIYFDLYARAHKRGGAWMGGYASRFRKNDGKLQAPVAYLTCNFSQPIGDQPALFTYQEVNTLFHELGHCLHHVLTDIDYPSVAGTNGVAWDAVELPSQFMENWLWQKDALDLVSGHYETGDSLPEEMLNRLISAKNFQSGMQMLRQLEFGIFDFRLHSSFSPKTESVQEVLNDVRKEVAVTTPPDFNRFQNGFSHIFAGGYAAGYYSYKWAEVLSSDAFSKFEKEGIFNQETGQAFLNNILKKGGSKPAMDLFVDFMGREPNIDALLRHSGIES